MRVWTPPTAGMYVAVLLALTASMMVVPASAAATTTSPWQIQKSADATLPGGQIESVSCVTATACTAVGSYSNTSGATVTLAEAWNGTSWKKHRTPNPVGGNSPTLLGVSCTAANFCEATGFGPPGDNAEVWNGSSWS